VSLNHGLLLFGMDRRGDQIAFSAYDPNNPDRTAELVYDSQQRAFIFERNPYFAGGPVQAYEVYRGWCY
jgi:hypothetical protein